MTLSALRVQQGSPLTLSLRVTYIRSTSIFRSIPHLFLKSSCPIPNTVTSQRSSRPRGLSRQTSHHTACLQRGSWCLRMLLQQKHCAGHPEKGSIKSPILGSSTTSHGDGAVESWSYSLLRTKIITDFSGCPGHQHWHELSQYFQEKLVWQVCNLADGLDLKP